MREVKRDGSEPLFICPIVFIGEAYSGASQNGAKYCICVDFSETNGGMHWTTHSIPDL